MCRGEIRSFPSFAEAGRRGSGTALERETMSQKINKWPTKASGSMERKLRRTVEA
jgi:hypothetical protein